VDGADAGRSPGMEWVEWDLGPYAACVERAIAELDAARIVPRIWARDHTVWRPEPTEIANRLGWLDSPVVMDGAVAALTELRATVRADGYRDAVLVGMGGSSLAPELFARTLSTGDGFRLQVLDSTDPQAVSGRLASVDLARTLLVVATKSGGTVETFSLFRYAYNQVVDAVGAADAGRHFVAITDPGSALADVAARLEFRATLLNDPNIGGRFSALSHFGLAPAALAGADVARLLASARTMADACGPDVTAEANPAARLGAAIAELGRAGRDKLTLVVSPSLGGFDAWVEQLVAESTGKDGTGILPVVGESPGTPADYGDDRQLVHVRASDGTLDAGVRALTASGVPTVTLHATDAYDLGGHIFLWELATAIAGHLLGIQPFDQPNVEAAKAAARAMVAAYRATGRLPDLAATLEGEGLAVYGDTGAASPLDALGAFLGGAGPAPGVYVALQAFVPPSPATDAALDALRDRIRSLTRLAVTVGYGPRFLHSTGQLHKGDAGRGLFVQFTCDATRDVAIPDEAGAPGSSISFAVLEAAQALGDRQALLDAGRRVLRIHLGADVATALCRLAAALH
jgi:glucose-6-phosphate isomerase